MDMEISDGESEDGQITKFEQEEEKVGRIFNKPSSESEPITLEELEKCRLTRDLLAKHSLAPWFEDYVKGSSLVIQPHVSCSPTRRCMGTVLDWARTKWSSISDL